MKAKQAVPIIATLAPVIAAAAPPVLIIGGLSFLLWLVCRDNKRITEGEPELEAPLHPVLKIPPESAGKTIEKPHIPAISAGIPAPPPPLPSALPADFLQVELEDSAPLMDSLEAGEEAYGTKRGLYNGYKKV
ncbi:MAG TPA: hypothetical protein VMH87_02415 [Pseudomonadales bacterium]|nr:hypothetical protein [Pseudomonadales bacterium]